MKAALKARMKSILLACSLVFAVACSFDASTPLVGEGQSADAGADSPSCEEHSAQPCGDCGYTACTDTPAGPQIECRPEPEAAGLCAADAYCTSEGMCESEAPISECASGETRECGDCGVESCQVGQWAGCAPLAQNCSGDRACLSSEAEFSCALACSTEGRREPCDGGAAIPDFVALGDSWHSQDGCVLDDACRKCTCRLDFFGTPRADCSLFCTD